MDIRATITVGCLLIAALNVPLILRRVPPNSTYGFRTKLTLSTPEIWYPANAFAGVVFVISSSASIAFVWLAPGALASQEWFPVAALLLPLLVALAVCLTHLRRYS